MASRRRDGSGKVFLSVLHVGAERKSPPIAAWLVGEAISRILSPCYLTWMLRLRTRTGTTPLESAGQACGIQLQTYP